MTKQFPADRPHRAAAARTAPDASVPRLDAGRVVERVQALIEPIVAVHHCEIVSVELRREPIGMVLRLYVERLGHDPRNAVGGVTLESCTAISRDVSAALDVHEIIDHAYNLEVSSPGLDRPLVKPADFVRFAGQKARLHLSQETPLHPKRKGYKGIILAADEHEIRFRDEDVGEVTIPQTSVEKASLVYEAPVKTKPGKQASPRATAKKDGGAKEPKPKSASAEPGDAESSSGATHHARRS